jgi:hypothetical protein
MLHQYDRKASQQVMPNAIEWRGIQLESALTMKRNMHASGPLAIY